MSQRLQAILEPAASSWRDWTQDSDLIAFARADLAAAIEGSNP